jgi:hypothetical protein
MAIEEEKQEKLKWVVDFAQADFSKLRAGDRAKLLVEVDEIWFPRKEDKKVFEVPPKDTKEYWDFLGHLQEVIQKFFHDIKNTPSQKAIRILKPTFHLALYQEEKAFRFGVSRSLGDVLGPEWTLENFIEFKLSDLLNELPPTVIRVCLECKRFFVNLSRRKKKFCSLQCMWRFNAEKKRNVDPEAYRLKQRKVMRKWRKKKREITPSLR